MSIENSQISEAGGRTVAADLTQMFSSVDTALLDAARLASSIMETSRSSTVAPARLQPILDSAALGFAKMVEGRKDMVSMHRGLALMKKDSNLDVYDFGCYRVLTDTFFSEKRDQIAA